MVSITLMSRIPISAPLDVMNRSLAIIEFIAAMASACCRSSLGLGTVIAYVLPPAVVNVNLKTLFVVRAMLSPPLYRIFRSAIDRPAQSFSYIALPTFTHQVVVNEISWHFNNYFKGKPCRSLTAPLDIRLFGYATKFEEDPNVVQPDVIVICDENKVNEKNKYEGIPSLVVEVLSPSTKGKDLAAKLNLYMKSGVLEYWVVNLENESILQYSFSKERDIDNLMSLQQGDTIQSTVFSGLEILLSDIFSEI